MSIYENTFTTTPGDETSNQTTGRGMSMPPEGWPQARMAEDHLSLLLDNTPDFGNIPGLDPDASVEGGVDPSKDDDNCTGGACKI